MRTANIIRETAAPQPVGRQEGSFEIPPVMLYYYIAFIYTYNFFFFFVPFFFFLLRDKCTVCDFLAIVQRATITI